MKAEVLQEDITHRYLETCPPSAPVTDDHLLIGLAQEPRDLDVCHTAFTEAQDFPYNFFWNSDINPGFKGLVAQQKLDS